MDEQEKKKDLHQVFTVWVAIKALGGFLQLALAALLLSLDLNTLRLTLGRESQWVRLHGLRYLDLSTSQELSAGTQHYAALYLLVHGVSKLVLAVCLLRGQHWAYPASIIALVGFVAFQGFQLSLAYSLGLLLLTLYDMILIWLIWMEYQYVKTNLKK